MKILSHYLVLWFSEVFYFNGLAAMLAKEVFSHAVVPKFEPNFGLTSTNRSHIIYWWIGFLPSKIGDNFPKIQG
ncbi:MAG TPA: hypothetical protein VE944_03900 [Nostoc sp.]|uniref:hypothetical protein n=1 Tax=Nostoc sp. TaxID=1180 RepID=UPI002D4776A4|nr:hypothetical protein [Nostoc sp.]HYX13507.1 hypothetical protein [Nostoc sp.]